VSNSSTVRVTRPSAADSARQWGSPFRLAAGAVNAMTRTQTGCCGRPDPGYFTAQWIPPGMDAGYTAVNEAFPDKGAFRALAPMHLSVSHCPAPGVLIS